MAMMQRVRLRFHVPPDLYPPRRRKRRPNVGLWLSMIRDHHADAPCPSYVSNVGKRLTRDTTSWKTFSTAVLFARSELGRASRYGQIFDAIYGSHLMPSWSMDDPRRWRDRAEEARLVAADMKDPDSKEAMLRIAKHYERLADRAQRLGKGLP
jgi:hypothetical protein